MSSTKILMKIKDLIETGDKLKGKKITNNFSKLLGHHKPSEYLECSLALTQQVCTRWTNSIVSKDIQLVMMEVYTFMWV